MTGDDRFLDAVARAEADRSRRTRRRSRAAWGVSAGVTIIWLVYVIVAGHRGRVVDNLVESVVMIFGSLVAGSTPQGGGAVAFPVYTKVFDIPANVARSFSLSIQAVGMGVAATAIVIRGRRLDRHSLRWGVPAAVAGLLIGFAALAERDQPFWPSRIPSSYVKVTFTVVIAAMALALWMEYRSPLIERRFETRSVVTVRVLLVGTLLVGGVVSSLTGSGTDVFLYVLVAVILGVSPEVAVPTSVVAMAAVSIVGFLVLGVVDGQLDVVVGPDDQVVEVGGEQVGMLGDEIRFDAPTAGAPASRYDLFGLWLAAAPIVAWGAPVGAWLSARATDRMLVRIVVLLAGLEVVSTLIFLTDLHDDPVLVAYMVLGFAAVAVLLRYARGHRERLSGVTSDVGVGGDLIDAAPELGSALDGRTDSGPDPE